MAVAPAIGTLILVWPDQTSTQAQTTGGESRAVVPADRIAVSGGPAYRLDQQHYSSTFMAQFIAQQIVPPAPTRSAAVHGELVSVYRQRRKTAPAHLGISDRLV